MKVEIYPVCQSRELSAVFLKELEQGWTEVFELLRGIGVGEIVNLDFLEVSLLDDGEMEQFHEEFLGDSTTTDVITFEHGELLIGVQVAARQAVEFQSQEDREIALYGIHGMLHLSGFDDKSPEGAREMAERQEEILQAYFPFLI